MKGKIQINSGGNSNKQNSKDLYGNLQVFIGNSIQEITNNGDKINEEIVSLDKQINELSIKLQEKKRNNNTLEGSSDESSTIAELLLVIRDFNEKIEQNQKKAKKEKENVEKAKMDHKEMMDQRPLFINEKVGLIEQIEENYLKSMTYSNFFKYQYQYDILEVLFERIFLNKVDYYVNLLLIHDYNIDSKTFVPKPIREEETVNRNLSDKLVNYLARIKRTNDEFIQRFIGNQMQPHEFQESLRDLVLNKATNDASVIINEIPKLVLREILIVQQVEDLNEQCINLTTSPDFAEITWQTYSLELQRILHAQLARSGYEYEFSEKEIPKNDLAFKFINLLKDINPEILYKHLKNEMIFFHFRNNCFDAYKFKNKLLASEHFNLESQKEAINYFEMMNRLKAIKAQGHFYKHDRHHIKLFYFLIKIVIVIAFDTMTKKRIENKQIDIDTKEMQITNWENEIKEIKSKIELILDIKSNVEMGKTSGERRQMAKKENDTKDIDKDQSLIDMMKFHSRTLRMLVNSQQKTVQDLINSVGEQLINQKDIVNMKNELNK